MPNDPFTFDEDDDGDQQPKAKTAEELQKDLARMGKALRDSEKARKDLEVVAGEAVATVQKATLKEAGLADAQAGAFLKLYDAVTPENIAAFRTDILGVAQKTEDPAAAAAAKVAADAEAAKKAAESGFNPQLGAATETKPVGAGKISTTDLAKLAKENPQEADRMVNEGLVELPSAEGVELIWRTK